MDEEKRLLVIAAHPDDEVLGCGATVALRVQQKWRARALILTGGIGGRSRSAEIDDGVRAAQTRLAGESDRAAKVIGLERITRLDFPDNRLDTVARQDVAHAIREALDEFRPSVVMTHHPGDYNWDHTIAFDAVMMAARACVGEPTPREILAFEVPSSTERSWQSGDRAFHPTVYVDVKRTIDKKKLALKYYETEYHAYPHPRSVEGLEYVARRRGLDVGIEYAEAFALVRRIEA